jgi:hypothetical protein
VVSAPPDGIDRSRICPAQTRMTGSVAIRTKAPNLDALASWSME